MQVPACAPEARNFMDTLVTIDIRGSDANTRDRIDEAFSWFAQVEARCSRFDPESELRRLCVRPGEATPVSPMLFGALQFALNVAQETGGIFDPTVGRAMQGAGFNRNHRSGESWEDSAASAEATYRDILLDPARSSVTLLRPLLLDLGALAKGLAIDLAAGALSGLDFCINAGGDLRCGSSCSGEAWEIGIRHPAEESLLDTLEVRDLAVCTSGAYERGDHIQHPIPGYIRASLASATVVAGSAMAADALSTAAFLLGPKKGIALLTRQGVEGMLVTPELEVRETAGFHALRA